MATPETMTVHAIEEAIAFGRSADILSERGIQLIWIEPSRESCNDPGRRDGRQARMPGVSTIAFA